MTIVKQRERIAAGEFKAKCLALLDRVAETRESFVVTKRGRPVAMLVPLEEVSESPLVGSVIKETDIVSPIGEGWDAES
jgi:prevent-host-death family protein